MLALYDTLLGNIIVFSKYSHQRLTLLSKTSIATQENSLNSRVVAHCLSYYITVIAKCTCLSLSANAFEALCIKQEA